MNRGLTGALSLSAIFVFLAGCGVLPFDSAQGRPAQDGIQQASKSDGPFLSVAHRTSHGGRSESVVSIISLPQDKVLTRITGYGYISGVCSDASGNVWVPNQRHGHWYVDQFARGGSKEIDQLRAPHRWSSFGACAVDPTSGNLAVMGANIDGANKALIWSGVPSGKPAMYSLPFCPVSAAYDGAGNLFMTGWACGSTFNAYFGELAKGSGHVALIKLDKRTGPFGGVQWDGTYVVVAVAVSHRRVHRLLYRVQVSGTTGKVARTVKPQGFYMCYCFGTPSGLFVLHDGTIIGTAGKHGEGIWMWPYPAGGERTQSIARYEGINEMALSM
jgi:hypothetical protein